MVAIELEVTTDGAGAGTVTKALRGSYLLHMVDWIDGDFDNGVDGTLKCVSRPFGADRTLLTLTDANADEHYFPRELEHGNTGAELTSYTLPVVDGSLQLTIAQGGAAKTGGCVCYLMEA